MTLGLLLILVKIMCKYDDTLYISKFSHL